ncbi:MAG: hypothetical protein ACLPV8_19270 [Steroidobacteraceae bacterium]
MATVALNSANGQIEVVVLQTTLNLPNGSLPILGLYTGGIFVSGVSENAEGFNAPLISQ